MTWVGDFLMAYSTGVVRQAFIALCNFFEVQSVYSSVLKSKGDMRKMAERSTVVGVFADQQQAEQAIRELKQVGFGDEQIGFLVRHSSGILGGLVGGVMGAADAVLLPALGPTEANAALESALPLSEEAIERLQHTHKPAEEETTPTGEQATATGPDQMRNPVPVQPQESAARPENVAGEENSISPTEVSLGGGEGIVSGGIAGGFLGAAAALLIPGIGPAVAGGILVTTLGGAALGAVTGGLLGAFTDMGIPEDEAHLYRHELEAGHMLVTVQAEPERVQEVMDILHRNGATNVE
jgi:hypothetical protein